MMKNKRRELLKKYFIPKLTVTIDGEEVPVVTTVQSHYEWVTEYERAERYRKLTIIETFAIVLLSVKLFKVLAKSGAKLN